MSIKLQSDTLTCHLNQDAQKIILESRLLSETSIAFGISLDAQTPRAPLILANGPWQVEEMKAREFPGLPFTMNQAVQIKIRTSVPGVTCHLVLSFSTASPLLFLKMEVNNASDQPVTLNRLTPLKITPGGVSIHGTQPHQPAFYSNGWQSWSSTGAYQAGAHQHHSILGPFQNPMVINPGTPKPRGQEHFSGDMFGVLGDLSARVGFLAGFLSQKHHFGSLETRFTPQLSLALWANGDGARIPAGESVQTDWASLGFVEIDAVDPLQPYLSASAQTHGIQSKEKVPIGWCSWYHFYTEINEKVIESNLETVKELQATVPLRLFQIDDGFETKPGDWFDFDPGFPNGLARLVQKTRAANLTPGVWLAPFIVHPGANLVKEHPDWLLRNKKGRPVTAGFVWNRFTYALDLTNPKALDYTQNVIQRVVEDWGFDYLKLDFLYAAALDGVYQDPTKTRAEVLRMGLEALRQAAGPEVTLLGCGCPLGSGL